MKITKYFLFLLIGLALIGCRSSKTSSDLTTHTTPSGLKYEDVVIGAGPEATFGKRVSINYRMQLENGTAIENENTYATGKPFIFVLGSEDILKGLNEGVSGMRVGGRRKLYIPPDLAYGNRSVGSIPANSILVMDVELVKIE